MSNPANAVAADLPYPLMIHALTGNPMAALPLENLDKLGADLPGATQRIANSTHLGTDYSVDDPNDLTQTGWGVIFASDADPAIQAQLQPLLDLRQKQVQDPKLFKVYSGATNGGVLPGQTAASWAQQRGVSLTAPVDPYQGGVPYYLLLVGSPDRIPFEFQALLKMQWAVGRLAFDDVEDYGRYAQAVVQYESPTFKPVQRKSAAVWVTRNYGDLATAMLSGAICQDFLATVNPLGSQRQFNLDAFPNEKATKAQLADILRGKLPGGPPAVFFTGSHGCDYSGSDPAIQRHMQGSLVTQEWIPGTQAGSANQFCADDVPADANLQGTMGFLFACFSAGCPTTNSYYFNADGSAIPLAPVPMIARLPQALLSRGALAIIGHVDLAFPYAFQDVTGTPQVQAIRTPLEMLMRGKRAGLAADSLSILWSSLSAQLGVAQGANSATPATAAASATASGAVSGAGVASASPSPSASPIARLTIARDDARNYIVLGDPATRLRIADLT
jgi:hypothetical protein